MSYTVIARKWRPQTFEDVVGQDHVVRTLRNAIRQQRIAQAYLFVGPRGIGKTTLARIFAKALNCVEGPTENPCGVCDPCREIAAGNSFDVSEIDGASNNKVEDIHAIRDGIQYAPVNGKFRICYIDEVHMLSQSAFNALLKTLEEPPAHAKFLFATTEVEKIPATVISRCQRFDLKRISVALISERLRMIAADEKIEVSDDALLAIARGAEGGMRDAQSALDQLIAFTGAHIEEDDVLNVFGLVARKTLEALVLAILRGDVPNVLKLVDELDHAGKDLRRLTVELINHFRNLLVYLHLQGKTDSLDLTEAQEATLKVQAPEAQAPAVLQILEILIDLDGRLRLALSRRTLLETALIRAARAARVVSLEEILRRLNELQKQGGGAVAPAGTIAPPAAASAPPPAASAAASRSAAAPAPLASAPAGAATQAAATQVRESSPADSATTASSQPPPNHEIAARPAVQRVAEALGGKIVDIQ